VGCCLSENQIELPRALNDLGLALLDSEEFLRAFHAAQESQAFLDIIQTSQETVAPEFVSCQKDTLLIEARGKMGLASNMNDPEFVDSINKLLQRARELGATSQELAEFGSR